MNRYIDADDVANAIYHHFPSVRTMADARGVIEEAPSIEPNLILPERMERGDIYEVGETIVVMNHDDYYDLLCKSWMPKRGEWIDEADKYDASFGIHAYRCSNCNSYADEHIGGHEWYTADKPNFCPNCGARMKGADDE